MNLIYQDKIDLEVWGEALTEMRRYSGMPSIKIIYNPYQSDWEVTIDYSCNTSYTGKNGNINMAIIEATHKLYMNPPNSEKDEIL